MVKIRFPLAARAGAAAMAAVCAGVLALTALSPLRVPEPAATRVVRMEMVNGAARFRPAAITIHPGDRVRFVVASGGPHNVSFDPAKVPADARRVLTAAMSGQIQPLSGPLLLNPGDSYAISFAGVKPGRYEFFCMPHAGMGMKGVITVE